MGNTTASGIWTPDEHDNLDPEVWSAAMASSIEDGIGGRLAKQEQRVGAKISIDAATTVPSTGIIFPLVVAGNGYAYSFGNFMTGMTLAGGVLSVTTPGLYLLISSIICDFVADRTPMDMIIAVNGQPATSESLETSPTTWASKSMITSEYLNAGDTVYLTAQSHGTTDVLPVRGANLNAVMLYAT
jgi:hypothetical protein